MPRSNKSRFAVLGILNWQPASGYDVRRIINESIGKFWNESYGQIYPTLKELEIAGLAERTVEQTEGKPDRHVYSITETGRQELIRWLEQPCDPHVYRVEVMIKLFFGALAELHTSLSHLARFRTEHQALLAHYQGIRDHLLQDCRDDPGLPFWLLNVDCGLRVGQAYIDWCNHAEQVLQKLAKARQTASDKTKAPSKTKGKPATKSIASLRSQQQARQSATRGGRHDH